MGSVLNMPYQDCGFDYVYSIGCLHHTGDLVGSISEVYRVLKVKGKALIMSCNRNSFRLLVEVRIKRALGILSKIRRNTTLNEKNQVIV